MGETERLKSAVREVLGAHGARASDLLVCRIDEILGQAGKTPGGLPKAGERVVMMARLFADEDPSGAIVERFPRILDATLDDDDLDDMRILDEEDGNVEPTADSDEEEEEDEPGLLDDRPSELLELFDDPDELDDDVF